MTACEVDFSRCDALSSLVAAHGGFPPDVEDPIAIALPKSQLATVNLVTVAINHQTTPLVGPPLVGEIDGKECRGWDYLWRRWVRVAEERRDLLTPESLSAMRPDALVALLADGKGGGVISDVERRAAHIADLGTVMLAHKWDGPADMFCEAGALIGATDREGIRGLLREFVAYASDPLEKKTRYMLALQKNTVGWRFADPQHLGTPVNYHESRIHLRLGTVRLLDPLLLGRLIRREPVTQDEDLQIRGAVTVAINYISSKLGILPSTAHYAFWNFARNVCPRDKTHCDKLPDPCGLPKRYRLPTVQGCLFAPICDSRGKDPAQLPVEHSFDTDWY
ncbi:MAG: hypothetical protein RLZZ324_1052 [Candidatus Parcubacteria bacterium]|jgi:hypothetical protein